MFALPAVHFWVGMLRCCSLRLLLFCTCPPLCAGALWPMPAWVWRDIGFIFFSVVCFLSFVFPGGARRLVHFPCNNPQSRNRAPAKEPQTSSVAQHPPAQHLCTDDRCTGLNVVRWLFGIGMVGYSWGFWVCQLFCRSWRRQALMLCPRDTGKATKACYRQERQEQWLSPWDTSHAYTYSCRQKHLALHSARPYPSGARTAISIIF